MPFNRQNQRFFHRTLFSGMLERITLLKRNDDQQQGIVTAIVLFQSWHGQLWKTGETIQGEMASDHRATWHIPRIELDRVGVNYINALDRIQDFKGRIWQPEGTTRIGVKLIEVHVDVDCLLLNQ